MDWLTLEWIKKVQELREKNIKFALVTLIHSAGSTPRKAGAKMIVLEDGESFGTTGGGAGEQKAISAALDCLKNDENKKFCFALDAKAGQVCGGETEVFIEVIGSREKLFILGAGHVAQAIAQVLQDTPFEVHLLDPREEWCRNPSLPKDVVAHIAPWEKLPELVEEHCYCVIMTPDHKYDYEFLEKLARKNHRYLGVIGSRGKWATFEKRLLEAGLTPEQVKAVHCPIGVAKAGSAPREVAISFAAEILAEHYQTKK